MQARILVVEDDLFIQEVIATALSDTNYSVEVASDGLQAWDRLAAALPALVVLDLALPFEDGITICRKLRAQLDTATLPILVISAMSNTARVRAVLEAGADAFLAKPFDLDELVSAVGRLLDGRKATPRVALAQARWPA